MTYEEKREFWRPGDVPNEDMQRYWQRCLYMLQP